MLCIPSTIYRFNQQHSGHFTKYLHDIVSYNCTCGAHGSFVKRKIKILRVLDQQADKYSDICICFNQILEWFVSVWWQSYHISLRFSFYDTSTNEQGSTGSPQTVYWFFILNIIDYRFSDFCNFHQWHRNARKTWIAILQPTDILFHIGLAPMTPRSVTGEEYIIHLQLLSLLVPLHHSQGKDNGDGSDTAPYHDLHPDFVR